MVMNNRVRVFVSCWVVVNVYNLISVVMIKVGMMGWIC